MHETREEFLLRFIQWRESEVPSWIEAIEKRKRGFVIGAGLTSLSQYWFAKGVYSYFVQNNKSGLKQAFFLSSKLRLLSASFQGGEQFDGAQVVLTALLSDSEDVIYRLARCENAPLLQGRQQYASTQFFVYLCQLAIQNGDGELKDAICEVRKKTKKIGRAHSSIHEFFELLLARDTDAITRLLIEQHTRQTKDDPISEQFMRLLAVLEMKLCWRRGLEVRIDHPMIPMDLMPIEPLAEYDDTYTFLCDGWGESPKSILENMRKWGLGLFKM